MFPSDTSQLQSLKSKLLQYVAAKENSLSMLEKNIEDSLTKERESKYASMVKELSQEEQKQIHLEMISQCEKKLTLKMTLIEQIEERKISKAEKDALMIAENLLKEDIGKKIKEEKIQKRIQKSLQKTDYRAQLEEQINQQKLEQNKTQENDKILNEFNGAFLEIKQIKEDVDKEMIKSKTIEKSKHQLDQMSLLQEGQKITQERKNLLEEISCLNKMNEEEVMYADKISLQNQKNISLIKDRDYQLRMKEESEMNHKLREEKYCELLMQLQREEGKLDDLKAEARRRRTLDHRDSVHKILQARKKRRQELQKEFEEMERAEAEVSNLRQQILEEEEKKVILEYLPHLEPHLGRKLLEKLSTLY